MVEEVGEEAAKRRRIGDGDAGASGAGGSAGSGHSAFAERDFGVRKVDVRSPAAVAVGEGRRRASGSDNGGTATSGEGGWPSQRDAADSDDVAVHGKSRLDSTHGDNEEGKVEGADGTTRDLENHDAINFYDDAVSFAGAPGDKVNGGNSSGGESQFCEFVPIQADGQGDEPQGLNTDVDNVGERGNEETVAGGGEERWEQDYRVWSGSTGGEKAGVHGGFPGTDVCGGGSRGGEGAEGTEQRPMFGRGGSSGVFGEVDPGVLAELPPEIQREIWMQQVRGGGGGAGVRLPSAADMGRMGIYGGDAGTLFLRC